MFLLSWYERYLKLKLEAKGIAINLEREQVCETCEYLKLQIEKQQVTINELIAKLTKEPEQVVQQFIPTEIPKPRHIPFNVRRQILEGQDRLAATKLREAQAAMATKVNISPSGGVQIAPETTVAPADDPDVIALEKEMDLAAERREAQK